MSANGRVKPDDDHGNWTGETVSYRTSPDGTFESSPGRQRNSHITKPGPSNDPKTSVAINQDRPWSTVLPLAGPSWRPVCTSHYRLSKHAGMHR